MTTLQILLIAACWPISNALIVAVLFRLAVRTERRERQAAREAEMARLEMEGRIRANITACYIGHRASEPGPKPRQS